MQNFKFNYLSLLIVLGIQSSCLAQFATFGGFQPIISEFQPVYANPPDTSGGVQPIVSEFQPTFSNPPASSAGFQPIVSGFQPTFSNPPASSGILGTFTSTFSSAVESSLVLKDLLNINQVSLQDFAKRMFGVLNTSQNRSHHGSSDKAKTSSQPPKMLNLPMLVSLYGNIMGNQLIADGILNDFNAADIANSFAKQMELGAQKAVGIVDQSLKLQCSMDAFAESLKSQGLFTKEKLAAVRMNLDKEIRRQRKQNSGI